jgi:hypothetical protein
LNFRVAYADDARAELVHMAPERRAIFDKGMAVLASNPYRHGSTPVRGDRDRREATIADVALIRYAVSPTVLVVTVLKLVPAP